MESAVVIAVNKILGSGKYHSFLSLVKGFRNGAVYGVKVRFPHALVMTLLFRGGPLLGQAQAIFDATLTHSKNLAAFVLTYKTLLVLLREFDGVTQQYHAFIAALIGGYLVFGRYNKINEQINLYLLSRILYGLAKLSTEKGYIPRLRFNAFPVFAAIVWGTVLWLFEHHQHTLQPSLQASMNYLYHDSNRWTSLKDFIVHNE